MREYEEHRRFVNGRSRRQERRGGVFGTVLAFCALLMLLCLLCLTYLNQKREIAQIEANITACTKCLESLKPQLANRRTEVEALKSSRVVEYAMQRGMNTPNVGQICEVSPRLRTRNVMVAENGSSQGSKSMTMATIAPQQLK